MGYVSKYMYVQREREREVIKGTLTPYLPVHESSSLLPAVRLIAYLGSYLTYRPTEPCNYALPDRKPAAVCT